MKKVLGCLRMLGLVLSVLVLTLLLALVAWINYPPLRVGPEVEEISRRCQQREQAEQKLAGDVDNNGYLHPQLLPYWGSVFDQILGCPAEKSVGEVIGLSDLVDWKDKGLEKAVARRDPEVRRKFARYGNFYSLVHEAIHKPQFLVPRVPPYRDDREFNTVRMSGLLHSMAAYSEYLCLMGQAEQALNVSRDGLLLSWKLRRQQSSTIQFRGSVSLQSISLTVLSTVLQSSQALPPLQALEQLSDLLAQTYPEVSEFHSNLEAQFHENLYRLTAANINHRDESIVKLERIPGMASREVRMFKNEAVPILKAFERQPVDLAVRQPSFSWNNWLLGRSGLVSGTLQTNPGKSWMVYQQLEARQAFLHLYVQLLKNAHHYRSWPADLKTALGSDYRPLNGLNLEKVNYRVEGKTATISFDPPRREPQSSGPKPAPEMEKWHGLSVDGFKLSARLTGPKGNATEKIPQN